MLTEHEARKLQHDMRHELGATPAAVLKCAAALVILVVVAVVGSVTDLRRGADGTVATAAQTEQSQ